MELKPASGRRRSPHTHDALTQRIEIACKGMLYHEVAKLTGANHETVRRYLRGHYPPTVEFLGILAETLSLSCDWLVLGRGAMRRSEVIDQALIEASPGRVCRALGVHLDRACQPKMLKLRDREPAMRTKESV